MSTRTARSESAHGKGAPWTELHTDGRTGEAWRQVHRALFMAGEVPMLWAASHPAYHHLAFSYCHTAHALVSCTIRGQRDFRVGLRIHDSTLLLMGDAGAVLQQFSMAGKSLFEARTWLLDHAEALAGERSRNEPLQQGRFDPHPLGEGAPYGVDLQGALRQVDHAYGNATGALRRVLGDIAPGTAVRVWPHHADIAALVEVEGDGNEPSSVGLGLSPADDRIAEVYERHGDAYFYAAPWPPPKPAELPSLTAGAWLTDGPLLAALPLASVVATPGAKAQGALVDGFLREAYSAAESLL